MRGYQWKMVTVNEDKYITELKFRQFFRSNVLKNALLSMKAFEQVHMSRLSNVINFL